MENIYIVDRNEGKKIVLEAPNEDIINVDKIFIEEGVKSGDCLRKVGEYYKIDREATEKRKEEISLLMKGMWEE